MKANLLNELATEMLAFLKKRLEKLKKETIRDDAKINEIYSQIDIWQDFLLERYKSELSKNM